MTPVPIPAADPAVALLSRYFLNRTDRCAVRASWGKPCPATTEDLPGLLRAHVLGAAAPEVAICYQFRDQHRHERGHYRVGAYTPAPDGSTRWLCLDFDAGSGEKAYPLADATAAVRRVADRCRQHGLPPYLERSGGGKGWHLWLFFAQPLPAERARRLGLTLVPPDLPLVDGSCADPGRNIGVEVFPKKTRVDAGPGSMVWLPWWHGATAGGNLFYDLTTDLSSPSPGA